MPCWARLKGFPVTLCMPQNVSAERKKILSAYGANIIYTDAGEGSDGAIRKAREMAADEPEKYFYADQYSNDANWQAHYHGTANEIWRQTEGRVTPFCRHAGNEWHVHGDDAAVERTESGDSVYFAAAGFVVSRDRGSEAYGQRDCPQDL